jgi:hypothetical protein
MCAARLFAAGKKYKDKVLERRQARNEDLVTEMTDKQKAWIIEGVNKEKSILARARDVCLGNPPCFWCHKDGFSAEQCCSSVLSESAALPNPEIQHVAEYRKRQAVRAEKLEWENNAMEGIREERERHRKAKERDLLTREMNQMQVEESNSSEPKQKKCRTSPS